MPMNRVPNAVKAGCRFACRNDPSLYHSAALLRRLSSRIFMRIQHTRGERGPGNPGGDTTRHEHVPARDPRHADRLRNPQPAQAESWLELVEIVFGEPFTPEA